jgi:hypothetical protein
LSDRAGGSVYIVGSALFGGIRQPVRWALAASGEGWTIARAERLGVTFKTKPYGAGYARGVNMAGDAVGIIYDSRGVALPIRWSSSGLATVLPHPRSSVNAEALTINNAGWIAGYVEAPYQGAVVWQP